jgi:protein gp37
MTVQHKPKTGARGIEWCDRTVGPVGGCLHGCRWQMPDGTVAVCYAETIAENLAQKAYPHGFAHHYWRPHMLAALKAGDEPELRFCDSMGDLFGHWVPEEQVRAVLAAMREAPHHTYQSLTKAAPQLLKYLDDLPPNLWVGVSSPPDWFMGKRLTPEKQAAMLKRSMEVLCEVRERTDCLVWMSAEPVSWDLAAVLGEDGHPLDWCVIGAASNGPRYYQPEPEHVRRLLDLFDAAGTVFFKGNIRPLFTSHQIGRWREDFPAAGRDQKPIPAVVRRQERCREFGWTPSEFPAPTRAGAP